MVCLSISNAQISRWAKAIERRRREQAKRLRSPWTYLAPVGAIGLLGLFSGLPGRESILTAILSVTSALIGAARGFLLHAGLLIALVVTLFVIRLILKYLPHLPAGVDAAAREWVVGSFFVVAIWVLCLGIYLVALVPLATSTRVTGCS